MKSSVKLLPKVCAFIVLIGCFTHFSHADEADHSVPQELKLRAMDMVKELIDERFPELVNANITPKAIKNPAVFLATDINVLSVLTGEREYTLYLNKRLQTHPISDLALKGILAHELVHFTDYEKMNAFELASFYIQYLASDEFSAKYERATDLQSFERGYALGIKAFRYWLYQQITPEAKALKQKNYYTPAEIDEWLLSQANITLL